MILNCVCVCVNDYKQHVCCFGKTNENVFLSACVLQKELLVFIYIYIKILIYNKKGLHEERVHLVRTWLHLHYLSFQKTLLFLLNLLNL